MKITKEGWAVVEGDMLLSKYVEDAGRLDVAHPFLDLLHQYIPAGGVVVDVGACIGDHTITYVEWVGPTGFVWAFEPNPVALECLWHNMKGLKNLMIVPVALGAEKGYGSMIQEPQNIGASQVARGSGKVEIWPLDTFNIARLDFMKIDAEGHEPWILDGAKETIKRCRPVMVLEINEMLGRQGLTPNDVYQRLRDLDYKFEPSIDHSYDLVALP